MAKMRAAAFPPRNVAAPALFSIPLLTLRPHVALIPNACLNPHSQITSIAKSLGLRQDEFEMYGCHKAKVGGVAVGAEHRRGVADLSEVECFTTLFLPPLSRLSPSPLSHFPVMSVAGEAVCS